jgi:hypothetical protein
LSGAYSEEGRSALGEGTSRAHICTVSFVTELLPFSHVRISTSGAPDTLLGCLAVMVAKRQLREFTSKVNTVKQTCSLICESMSNGTLESSK